MSCQKKSKSKMQVKKSKTRKHRGGSYASDLVMEAANSSPVMNDFVANPRVRDGPNADYLSLGLDTGKQTGGSAASDMTMENLSDNAKTNKYAASWKVEGDINSLNTYQPSGGNRKSKSRNHKSKNRKSNKRNRKSKRSNNSNNSKNSKNSNKSKRSNRNKNQNKNKNHVVKGGASAYMADFYAIDSNKKQPNDMWNPPTRDLAGSGAAMGANEGANVYHVGAPLV